MFDEATLEALFKPKRDIDDYFPVAQTRSELAKIHAGTVSYKYFQWLYKTSLLPPTVRLYIWHTLHRTGLDDYWFREFKEFWGRVLHLRPLWSRSDFDFFRMVSRLSLQDFDVPENAGQKEHRDAWRSWQYIFGLMHEVNKEATATEFFKCKLALNHLGRAPKSVLEYGCSTGIITNTFELFHNGAFEKAHFWLADLENITFLYAAYRFSSTQNVTLLPVRESPEGFLQPEAFPTSLDIVFLSNTLEHLDAPLEIVKKIHVALAPGGILIFDYIKSQAKGLDSTNGLIDRAAVLRYILENFDIVQGNVEIETHVGVTVARKR